MSKKEQKLMNSLFFRWWKEEVEENEKLHKDLAELKAKNVKLKNQIYENSTRKRSN